MKYCYLSVCLYLCLEVNLVPNVQTTPDFLSMLFVAMTQFFHAVLPVLWIASCFPMPDGVSRQESVDAFLTEGIIT